MPKRKSADDENQKPAAKKKSVGKTEKTSVGKSEGSSVGKSEGTAVDKAEKHSVIKAPKNDINLSGKSSSKKQTAEEKLAAAPVQEDADELTDSRVFKMLQGMRLSPDESRDAAVNSRNLLIESWNSRDELYRELFGEPAYVTPGPYAPPSLLRHEDVVLPEDQHDRGDTGDPGNPNLDEQHLNVLVYAPDPTRPYWTYVTAGLSSPWLQDSPAEVTGFGCEIMIKTKEDMPWAVQILRTMAFYILNHAGTLSPGVRIDLNGPIIPNSDSKLTNIFIWYPDDAPDCWYYLPSGGFGLFIAIGITPDERQFAESIEEYGTWCIQQVLRQMGHDQITDPYRTSVMDQEGIGLALVKTKSFADNFRANVAYGGEPSEM